MPDFDLREIHKTVSIYFDGLYEGDTEKLASVFHPAASLTFLAEGKVKVWPREEWLAAVRGRGKPKDSGLERLDRILSVDVAGPDMAFVKVACQIPPRYFTDYLSLARVGGDWKVVAKTFHTETR